tara:strand:+ start:290 stop:484 length:195 start_codon:yes stop_codon:yes gene_type:complete
MSRLLTIIKVREIFRRNKVQLTTDAINLMDEHIYKEVEKMAKRCKEGNVKRLSADLFWVALGRK